MTNMETLETMSLLMSESDDGETDNESDTHGECDELDTNGSISRGIIIGSLCVACAQLFFSINDTIIKLSGLYSLPESQILFSRYSIQLLLSIIWWNCPCRKNKKTHKHWHGDEPYIKNIWLRGFAYFICTLTDYYAMYLLPLGDASCIFLQGPLWIVFIAHIFLKEQLPKLIIFVPSLILTLIGIILIIQPTFLLQLIQSDNYEQLDTVGVICQTVAMFGWVIGGILVRTAVNTHFLQLEMANSVQSVFIWIPLCVVFDKLFINNDLFHRNGWLFDIRSIFITSSVGIFGFAAMALLVIGYQYGEATKVAWLEYINIVIRFIIQIYIFQDTPNKYEIIGASMVLVGCMLPVLYELSVYILNKMNNQTAYQEKKKDRK
eukprot:27875_1